VLAAVIDVLPVLVACFFVTAPVFLVAGALAVERSEGFGFFDPTVSGDPMLRRLPAHPGLAAAAAVWLGLEVVALAVSRRSLGKWACTLRPRKVNGDGLSPLRAIGREALRGGLAGATLLVGVFGPRWLREDAAMAYAPHALTQGMDLPPYPRAVAGVIAGLAFLFIVHVMADVILVTSRRGGRSLADRLAGTIIG
jgi:hypothetical protein